MRFYRLLRYDLRQGLQRRNYLIATLLFSMRLFAVYRSVQFYCHVESISSRGSIGDYMLCLFRGMAIIQHGSMEEKVSIPIEWLIVCGFCLYNSSISCARYQCTRSASFPTHIACEMVAV